MAVLELKIRPQWQGYPGTLESMWKLFHGSITSILIGKYDIGLLTPLPFLPRVHRGVKNG